MHQWIKDLFGTEKPVIAMAHLPALPGTPRYDQAKGIRHMVDTVSRDVEYLVEGGVDAVMFCNEDDRPYVFEAGIEQIAAMASVVSEVRPDRIPFGVDFLWDPMAALAIANATGASFIREVITGVYESDMGLWSPNAGKLLRFRRQIGGENIRVFFNVAPEFASPLGTRSIAQRARSTEVSCMADVILVSGSMAGVAPDVETFKIAKDAVGDVPVFLNTGAKTENVAEFMSVADGVIVGSSLKEGGYTWNPVDPFRVNQFMEQVKICRNGKM